MVHVGNETFNVDLNRGAPIFNPNDLKVSFGNSTIEGALRQNIQDALAGQAVICQGCGAGHDHTDIQGPKTENENTIATTIAPLSTTSAGDFSNDLQVLIYLTYKNENRLLLFCSFRAITKSFGPSQILLKILNLLQSKCAVIDHRSCWPYAYTGQSVLMRRPVWQLTRGVWGMRPPHHLTRNEGLD